MRTFPHTLVDRRAFYEQMGQPHKRAFVPADDDSVFKAELESMEETDTEKQFKKIHTSAHRSGARPLGCFGGKARMGQKANKAEQIEKYKRAYETEKLRYSEERSKYFY